MYRTILMILYLIILIPSTTHLIRYRDIPFSRRLSAGLGIFFTLLAPTLAGIICELLASLFSVGLFLLIFVCGIGLIIKSLFVR